METVQITKEKLNKFAVAGKYYHTKHNASKSQLWMAIDALLELAQKKLKKIEQQKDLTRVQLCKKDKSQYIEYDKKGGYQFTEEKYKELVEKLNIIDNELVEMPIQIIPKGQYPEKDLTFDLRDAFRGIVIPAQEYELAGLDTKAIEAMLAKENERVAAEPEEEPEEK